MLMVQWQCMNFNFSQLFSFISRPVYFIGRGDQFEKILGCQSIWRERVENLTISTTYRQQTCQLNTNRLA